LDGWERVSSVGWLAAKQMEEKIVVGLLWGLIVLLFIFWVLGFALHIGGGLIHILLVIAVVLFVFNLLTGRGARV
jgi:hypothetical protein